MLTVITDATLQNNVFTPFQWGFRVAGHSQEVGRPLCRRTVQAQDTAQLPRPTPLTCRHNNTHTDTLAISGKLDRSHSTARENSWPLLKVTLSCRSSSLCTGTPCDAESSPLVRCSTWTWQHAEGGWAQSSRIKSLKGRIYHPALSYGNAFISEDLHLLTVLATKREIWVNVSHHRTGHAGLEVEDHGWLCAEQSVLY